MKQKRKKVTMDLRLSDIEKMDVFKEEYKKHTGSNKVATSLVVGRLLDAFGTLSDESREILAKNCAVAINQIEQKRLASANLGMFYDMHAKKELNTIRELQGVIDYMTYGAGYHIETAEVQKKKRIQTSRGYAMVPADWIEIDPYEGKETDSVYVIEMRNHEELGLPHFVFASDGDPEENKGCIFEEAIQAYPSFREEVLEKQIEIQYSDKGEAMNLYEWARAPIIGIFKIEDADRYQNDDDYPYGAKFYKEETNDKG